MTTLSQTPTDRPTATEPQPYQTPKMTELGTVEVLTAGPDSGNLDSLIGGTGGFQDSTS